jgi:hypothetical protein
MGKAGLPYIVHEYMHEHWAPMYFAQVAWEMAEGDLHYVGSLPVYNNFRDVAVTEPIERLLATTTDRVTFECLKDFAVDEFFRRDVFVKGRASKSSASTAAYLDTTIWGTLGNARPTERRVKLPHRTVDVSGPTFDALFDALAEGAATLGVLAARQETTSGMARDELHTALIRLLVSESVLPMRATTVATKASRDASFRVPSAYNQMLLRRVSTDVPLVLTSTVASTAFPISGLDALALRALTEAPPTNRERWIHDLVHRSTMRIRVGDRGIEDRAEQIRMIVGALDAICTEQLTKLVELGILAC